MLAVRMQGHIVMLTAKAGRIRPLNYVGKLKYRFTSEDLVPLSVPFGDMEIGDLVEFEPVYGPSGSRAITVRLLAKDGDLEPVELTE